MELSDRAKIYLSKIEKDYNWSADKEETRIYLEKQNFEWTEELLIFQSEYSGLELTSKGRRDKFSAYLFSRSQIIKHEPLEIDKVNNKYIFFCGDHETAQFRFYILDTGEFCTIDNNGNLNIIHSSFDKKVEKYSLKDEIQSWKQNPYYYEVQNQKKLNEYLSSEFELIKECSDDYSSWWSNEDLIVDNGIWLERPEKYFHVYGKEEKNCDGLVENLKSLKILA